jgi:hypothetical protein
VDNAVIIFTPRIQVRAERVAEVLGIGIEQANRLLSQPETKNVIQAALEQSFQETTDKVLQQMSRVPTAAVPTRVDCAVYL